MATIDALTRAIKIAVERGMLPEKVDEETYLVNWQTMEAILDDATTSLQNELETRISEHEQRICECPQTAINEKKYWLSVLTRLTGKEVE